MTRTTRIAAAAALLGGLAAAGSAAAQDGPPSGGPMMMMGFGPGRIDFAAIDTDGDGSLSRAELVARATERLARGDTNGDGALTRAELVEALPGPRGGLLDLFGPDPVEAFADRVLAVAGATEAGQVAIADFAGQRVNFLLAFADTDRDSAISQAEADAMRDRHHGRRGGRGHHRDMGGGDRGPDAPAPQDAE
jgi:hypothetical protein